MKALFETELTLAKAIFIGVMVSLDTQGACCKCHRLLCSTLLLVGIIKRQRPTG